MKYTWKPLLIAALLWAGGTQASGESPTLTPLDCGTGRFRVFFSPLFRADTFLVDTETGMIWRHAVAENGESIWEPMRRLRP